MTQVWRMDLAPSDKMVLLALADAANDDGVTWLAINSRNAGKLDLVKKTSLSERTVQSCLRRLVEAGHLQREERPGRGCLYTVTPANLAPPQILHPANAAGGGANLAPKPSINRHSGSDEPVSCPKRSDDVPKEDRFAEAWKAYPAKGRERSKSQAKTRPIWREAAKAAGGEEALLGAVKRYVRDDQTHKGECGPPAFDRWLRDGRWEHWLPDKLDAGAKSDLYDLHARLLGKTT